MYDTRRYVCCTENLVTNWITSLKRLGTRLVDTHVCMLSCRSGIRSTCALAETFPSILTMSQ